ncbi:hypothetical protein FB446DRAFT_757997 [Lentinula raphanica]|nr:hypothetical protein FB446DRAFT_757997 [Lentinula raphanica]
MVNRPSEARALLCALCLCHRHCDRLCPCLGHHGIHRIQMNLGFNLRLYLHLGLCFDLCFDLDLHLDFGLGL